MARAAARTTSWRGVAAIKDDSGGSPGSSFSEYTYLGGGTIVVEDYAQPDVKLNYDSGTAGAYAGFDRFGRVVDHLWYDYGASADRDRFTYGYDRGVESPLPGKHGGQREGRVLRL